MGDRCPFAGIETGESFRGFDVVVACVPAEHVARGLGGLATAVCLATAGATNEAARNRLVERFANPTAADPRFRDQILVRDFDVLFDRIAFLVEPAKCPTKNVRDETNGTARVVRQANIEKLVRTIQKVGCQMLEATKRLD